MVPSESSRFDTWTRSRIGFNHKAHKGHKGEYHKTARFGPSFGTATLKLTVSQGETVPRHVVALVTDTRRAGNRAIDIPSVRRRILRAEMKIESMRLNGQRFLTKQLKGEPLGSETSINKLHRAALEVELADLR